MSLEGGGEDSNVSFLVGKVDTPAMTSKRIRIIGEGYVDSAGRLEIKIDRAWTSVKKVKLPDGSPISDVTVMDNVANSACK